MRIAEQFISHWINPALLLDLEVIILWSGLTKALGFELIRRDKKFSEVRLPGEQFEAEASRLEYIVGCDRSSGITTCMKLTTERIGDTSKVSRGTSIEKLDRLSNMHKPG